MSPKIIDVFECNRVSELQACKHREVCSLTWRIQYSMHRWWTAIQWVIQPDTEHKVVYHKYEFVAKDDICNQINNIDICNRWMKRNIKGRRNEDMAEKYIHSWVYFKQTSSEDIPHERNFIFFLLTLVDASRELTIQSDYMLILINLTRMLKIKPIEYLTGITRQQCIKLMTIRD